jgi:hypothetical protein
MENLKQTKKVDVVILTKVENKIETNKKVEVVMLING